MLLGLNSIFDEVEEFFVAESFCGGAREDNRLTIGPFFHGFSEKFVSSCLAAFLLAMGVQVWSEKIERGWVSLSV